MKNHQNLKLNENELEKYSELYNKLGKRLDKLQLWLPSVNASVNTEHDINFSRQLRKVFNTVVGVKSAIEEDGISLAKVRKETLRVARRLNKIHSVLFVLFPNANLKEVEETTEAKETIVTNNVTANKKATVHHSFSDLDKLALDLRIAQENLDRISRPAKQANSPELSKVRQMRSVEKTAPVEDATSKMLSYTDQHLKDFSKYSSQINKLKLSIPNGEDYILVRAPIWLQTSPILDEQKLRNAHIIGKRTIQGVVLEDQLLIATTRKFAAESSDREKLIAQVIKVMSTRMTSNLVDITNNKVFLLPGNGKLLFSWLLELDKYRALGRFKILRIDFPVQNRIGASPEEADENDAIAIRNVTQQQSVNKIDKLRGLRMEVDRRSANVVAPLEAEIKALKQEQVNLRAEATAFVAKINAIKSAIGLAKQNIARMQSGTMRNQAIGQIAKMEADLGVAEGQYEAFKEAKTRPVTQRINELVKKIAEAMNAFRKEVSKTAK